MANYQLPRFGLFRPAALIGIVGLLLLGAFATITDRASAMEFLGMSRAGQTQAAPMFFNTVPQTLPFSQNWTNTALITTDDDWSLVPGIVGYRGDDLAALQDVDLRTVTADGAGTPIDVNANRSDPDAFNTGGVVEFDGIANPVVALQGSATADVPHLVIYLNTVGQSSIQLTYNARDIDNGTGVDAVQPINTQYRVGGTGAYQNLAGGYIADASGPGAATLVTPVSVTLPAAANNQALVEIRIMTTNATGSDEFIGIDDINITGGGVGPTPTATATPIATPTATPIATPTATPIATPTATPAATPTATPIASPTATPVGTPTATPTATPVASPTATPTASPTATPVASPTATPAASPTATPTASPTPTVRALRIVNTATQPGQTVVVPVVLDSLGNESSASFSFNFDPAVLTNPVVALGNGVPAGSNLGTNTAQAAQGRIGVLVDSTNAYLAGTRQVVTITFNVAAGAMIGTYPVTFGSIPTPQSVSSPQGALLTTVYTTGNVQVGSTAAGVSIAGRVTTPDGRGIRNATVVMVDQAGNRRIAVTGSFGYYTFEDVEAGTANVVSVTSKRFRFSPRLVQAFDSLADVNFVGSE